MVATLINVERPAAEREIAPEPAIKSPFRVKNPSGMVAPEMIEEPAPGWRAIGPEVVFTVPTVTFSSAVMETIPVAVTSLKVASREQLAVRLVTSTVPVTVICPLGAVIVRIWGPVIPPLKVIPDPSSLNVMS